VFAHLRTSTSYTLVPDEICIKGYAWEAGNVMNPIAAALVVSSAIRAATVASGDSRPAARTRLS
jgi:hypothetical protein